MKELDIEQESKARLSFHTQSYIVAIEDHQEEILSRALPGTSSHLLFHTLQPSLLKLGVCLLRKM